MCLLPLSLLAAPDINLPEGLTPVCAESTAGAAAADAGAADARDTRDDFESASLPARSPDDAAPLAARATRARARETAIVDAQRTRETAPDDAHCARETAPDDAQPKGTPTTHGVRPTARTHVRRAAASPRYT